MSNTSIKRLTAAEMKRSIRYCQGYFDLRALIEEPIVISSQQIDGMPHGYDTSDPVFLNTVIRREAVLKLSRIEDAAKRSAPADIVPYLLEYIDHDCTVDDLYDIGLPTDVSKKQFLEYAKVCYALVNQSIPEYYAD